jgi:hypothetical protein
MGCSNSINNSVTFKNISDGDIYINFRGSIITVAAGQTTVVSNIAKGQYNYSTTYSVPATASSSGAQGNVTGTLTLKAGTKILFLYSSTLFNGAYTLFVTISNSDDQSTSSKIGLPAQNEQKTNLTGP